MTCYSDDFLGKYVPEEGEGDNLHFDPVIELPDLVDVKTGEEDEDVLYIHKAKLYRYYIKTNVMMYCIDIIYNIHNIYIFIYI